jgi:hypothetical protein
MINSTRDRRGTSEDELGKKRRSKGEDPEWRLMEMRTKYADLDIPQRR